MEKTYTIEQEISGNAIILVIKPAKSFSIAAYGKEMDKLKIVLSKQTEPKPEVNRCKGECYDNGMGYCMYCGYKIKMRNLTREEKIKLLERYSKVLSERGYIDDDWWCEKPTAIDIFLKEESSKK